MHRRGHLPTPSWTQEALWFSRVSRNCDASSDIGFSFIPLKTRSYNLCCGISVRHRCCRCMGSSVGTAPARNAGHNKSETKGRESSHFRWFWGVLSTECHPVSLSFPDFLLKVALLRFFENRRNTLFWSLFIWRAAEVMLYKQLDELNDTFPNTTVLENSIKHT